MTPCTFSGPRRRSATPLYDQLKRELAGLEAAFPDSGAQQAAAPEIGRRSAAVSSRFAVTGERMLSLDKAYSEAELRAFLNRVVRRVGPPDPAFVIEPKIDGLAISVTYEHGHLVRAVIRAATAQKGMT